MFMFFVGCMLAVLAGACAQEALYGAAIAYGLMAVGFFLLAAAEKVADALESDAEEEEDNAEIGEVEGP